ncbi:retrovirus-related pol polyprotein from transposon TNT 1-94 [Tanacetum coccineum]|uniref:Retrovirus-related pol polyprotein from transposon TNT 1-94 n=1 Tax=Tanacetum coccineum TaxID=301880 RepID=A0ABQ4Y5X1_9ASTR
MTHWLCCVENTVEDRNMDSRASFHATYCKEELERFKLRSGKLDVQKVDMDEHVSFQKVRLADDKLDVQKVDKVRLADDKLDVQVEASFSMIGMSMLASKGNVSDVQMYRCTDVQKVDVDLSFIMSEKTRNCRGWSKFIQKALAVHLLHQSKDLATMILLSKTAAGVVRAEIRVEAPKMLWADSVSTAYLIYRIPYVPIGLRIPEEEWRGKDTSLAHLKAAAQMKCDTAFGIRRVTRLSEADILHLRTQFMEPENLAKNDSIVAEHGLSSEITQSPGGSSDTSEGSENSGSFKDSGRSDEEYSEDGASSREEASRLHRYEDPPESPELCKESVQWKKAIIEEMVSLEKNQTWSLVRISAGKKASQRLWMFRVKEEQDGSKRYKARLVVKGFQQKRRVDYNEILSLVVKMTTIKLVLSIVAAGAFLCSDMAEFNKPKWQFPLVFEMKDRCSEKHVLSYVLTVDVTTVEWESRLPLYSWNEEPCSDVHQVGDEREVKVLRNFNRPPSELITEDGVLPEKGYSQFNDVSSGYLVAQPQVNPDSTIAQIGVCVFVPRAVWHGACSLARGVQFGMDRAVWHEPQQFSSKLNNISGLIPWTATTIIVVDTTLYLVSIIFRIYLP